MHLSTLFPAFALIGSVWSSSALSLASMPACASKCSAKVLTPANCSLTEIRSCFCTSTTLQYNVAECVVGTCNLTEQYIATVITQDLLCVGVPQESRSEETRRASIILVVITAIVIALRFVSRVFVANKVWWDDWLILGATICMIPNTTIPIYLSYKGLGKHFYDILPENILILGKLFYISQIFYVLLQNIPKFSILLLYIRIFPSPRFVLITKLAIGWMVCHTLAFLLAVAFQCTPVPHFWDSTIEGHCLNTPALVYVGGGFSIAEDIVIMFLPVSELKGLNMSLRKRVGLILMFVLGSFACVTSMVRLKIMVAYQSSLDTTWNNVDVVIWSEIETYIAVICACLMCIRPLFKKYMPTIFPTTEAGASRSTGNAYWGQKITSKLSNSRSGHEPLGEEDIVRSRGDRKSGNITVITESSVSYEMDKMDLVPHGALVLDEPDDGSTGSKENLHPRKK